MNHLVLSHLLSFTFEVSGGGGGELTWVLKWKSLVRDEIQNWSHDSSQIIVVGSGVIRSLLRILELKRIIVLIGLIKMSQKDLAACLDCQNLEFRNCFFQKKISYFKFVIYLKGCNNI